MTYVLGVIAGLLLGCIIGYLKNLWIWQKYLEETSQPDYSDPMKLSGVYIREAISFGVNILALVIAFFTRNLFPFNGIAYLIGTAFGLVIMNRVMVAKQKKAAEAIEVKTGKYMEKESTDHVSGIK